MENRSEKRSTNCKNQTQDRTSDQSTNRTTNSSQNSCRQRAQAPQPVHQGCRRRGRQELGSQLRPQQPLSLCAERRPA